MVEGSSKPYVIGYEREHERLERQARIARIESHLRHVPVEADDVVLDAGCGSGSMARLLAEQARDGKVVGLDANGDYLDYARARAADEGLTNLEFREGDIFALPFDDDTFDLVWCKYVLQWVNDPIHAVREFRRVTRPGGTVVLCHFDGFGITHHPVDEALQPLAERFFSSVVDPNVGPKCFGMLHQSGFTDIRVDIEADASFTVAGAIDHDRRRNWEDQLTAARPAAVEALGSERAATDFLERFFGYQDRSDTLTACYLYFVAGTVP